MPTTGSTAVASPSRGVLTSLPQVARRTGLADSAAVMAAVCDRAEVPLTVVGGHAYVALNAFAGDICAVALDDVAVLESGRLT